MNYDGAVPIFPGVRSFGITRRLELANRFEFVHRVTLTQRLRELQGVQDRRVFVCIREACAVGRQLALLVHAELQNMFRLFDEAQQ